MRRVRDLAKDSGGVKVELEFDGINRGQSVHRKVVDGVQERLLTIGEKSLQLR